MRYLLVLVLIPLFCACSNFRHCVDSRSFAAFGGTLFSSPSQITMKEVHLDSGTNLGHEVIVEGSVVTIGQHSTYLVISDDTARLLVVLTDLNDQMDLSNIKTPVRVLGTLERGKKGLPFILATAIRPGVSRKS